MNIPQPLSARVSFHDEHPAPGDSLSEILAGLAREQKVIDPKYFYDEAGSRLFDRITRLPEYYPTRTEIGILREYREEICQYCERGCLFIEPGSGSSEKVRLLLDDLRPSAYVPVDISADFLRDAALELGSEYPWLTVQAVCADFNRSWSFMDRLPGGKRVVFYPGSTIGNLEPGQAAVFLSGVRGVLGDTGGVLIGVDLHKSSRRLNAAYNDAAGVTADFNLNVLCRINRLLGAEFNPASFRHRAFYDSEKQRVEMHLVSARAQRVPCNGSQIVFREGESIHTENSYKYTVEGFSRLAATAGLNLERSWQDAEQLFSVHYLSAG